MNLNQALTTIRERLALERPLVAFDLETTGTSIADDRIVEIAILRLDMDGRRGMFQARVNPGVPIPKEACDVHGITDEDVKDCPRFEELAADVAVYFSGVDILAYNGLKFDAGLLEAEFARCGKPYPAADAHIIDPCLLFRRMEPHDLAGAVKFYLAESFEGHRASEDVEATVCVFAAQLERYPEWPKTAKELAEFGENRDPTWLDRFGKVAWRDGKPVLTFGKFQGRTLQQLVHQAPDYLRWLCGRDIPPDARAIFEAALQRKFPKAPAS